MADEFCRHDRDAKECPYCPLMRRKRALFPEAALSALPETDDEDDGGDGLLTEPKRTKGGRSSLDEWEDDGSAADGIADLYSRGLRHNPRGTGEQDLLSEADQAALGGV